MKETQINKAANEVALAGLISLTALWGVMVMSYAYDTVQDYIDDKDQKVIVQQDSPKAAP